jgi:hypothetical protein
VGTVSVNVISRTVFVMVTGWLCARYELNYC